MSHLFSPLSKIVISILLLPPSVGRFAKPSGDTVHLCPGKGIKSQEENIQRLWKAVASAVGYKGRAFVPHMTIGQAPNSGDQHALEFLNTKADALLESVKDIKWTLGSVVAIKKDEKDGGIMKFYDELFLQGCSEISYQPGPLSQHIYLSPSGNWQWSTDIIPESLATLPEDLSIATYNILQDPLIPIVPRIPQLIDTILEADADIITLQEVTDESLRLLLTPRMAVYRFSSRDPSVVCENGRNVLILSKYPFTSRSLDTGNKHKPATLAIFDLPSSSYTGSKFVLAAVHLSAGHASALLEHKARELTSVIQYVQTYHPNDEVVIAGDTNWPHGIKCAPIEENQAFTDVATALGFEQPTYDPSSNALAAKTVKENKNAHRYDRIYIRKNSSWNISDIGLFGTQEDAPSDHAGLKVHLQREDVTKNPHTITTSTLPNLSTSFEHESHEKSDPEQSLGSCSITEKDLNDSFTTYDWLPTTEQEQNMAAALELVRQVICAPVERSSQAQEVTQGAHDQNSSETVPERATPRPDVVLKLEAVGSYALGVHTCESDIDCLAVGNISPQTFWLLARSRLLAQAKQQTGTGTTVVKLRRFVKDAAVQMMELEAHGIKIDLQYCVAPKLVERWSEIPEIPVDSPLFALPASSLVTLSAYRDVLILRRVIPSLSAFVKAHRALKLFLSRRGLVGARFGYLGGFHLTLLLTRVAITLPHSAGRSAPHLVEAFLREYAVWDWTQDTVHPIPAAAAVGTGAYKRVVQREPMAVLSISKPQKNIASNASWNSVASLSHGLQTANATLQSGGTWLDVCGTNPLKSFIDEYRSFVKIEVHYWGGDCMQGRALMGWLESKIVSLLVQLHMTVPEVTARLWPQRLVDESVVDPNTRDPNSFYLLGLSLFSQGDEQTARRSSGELEAALLNALRTFEQNVRSNEKYYNAASTFISVSHAKRTQLPSSVLVDPFKWADNGIDLADEGDLEEELEEYALEAAAPGTTQLLSIGLSEEAGDDWEGYHIPSSSQRKRAAAAKAKARVTPHVPAGKLRTSTDVYNRLMWDATGNVAKDAYVIGYEDRFKGIKETPLTAWKREVEDESFIPFHRVVYFKRLTDNVHVWDRRTKIDLVFGSGAGAS